MIEFYNLADKYVYAITGLVVEDIDDSPCATTYSRWAIEKDKICSAPTVLGSDTIAALTDAITSTSAYANDFITDTTRTLDCNATDYDESTDPIEIQLQVGLDCYTSVHPDHMNVYDFSGWVTGHPGGEYNIEKWAQGWEGHPGKLFLCWLRLPFVPYSCHLIPCYFSILLERTGWYLDYPFYGNVTRGIPEHPMSR